MDARQIREIVEARREDMAAMLLELCAIPGVNPRCGGTGEYARAGWITSLLESRDIPYTVHRFPDAAVPEGERWNIAVRWPGRDEQAGTLWFISHLDTVSPGDRALWDTDPMKPVRTPDGCIYGLGAEDNGQAVVSILQTLFLLSELGWKPLCPVGFLFVSDEETSSEFGLEALVSSGVLRPGDQAVVPDYGCADGSFVEIAEKATGYVKITVTGKQAHAAMPHLGKNAFSLGSRFLVEAEDLLKGHYTQTDALYDPPYSTFEPTMTLANVASPNVIPGSHTFYMDMRILPQIPVEAVLETLERAAADFSRRYGVEITVENHLHAAPTPTPAEAPLVQRLLESIRETGVDARLGGIGGGTCAAILRRAGIPAVVWSTLVELAHQPNEYAILDNLVTDASVFLSLILKYCEEML